jgi:hypothetical protein
LEEILVSEIDCLGPAASACLLGGSQCISGGQSSR